MLKQYYLLKQTYIKKIQISCFIYIIFFIQFISHNFIFPRKYRKSIHSLHPGMFILYYIKDSLKIQFRFYIFRIMEFLCKAKLMLNQGGSFLLIVQLSGNSNVDVALSREIQDSNLRS